MDSNSKLKLAQKTADDLFGFYMLIGLLLVLGVCFELAIHEWMAAAGTLIVLVMLYPVARQDCRAAQLRVVEIGRNSSNSN